MFPLSVLYGMNANKIVYSEFLIQWLSLQVNNYALKMHLRQAQQSNSIPGRFHPDIF